MSEEELDCPLCGASLSVEEAATHAVTQHQVTPTLEDGWRCSCGHLEPHVDQAFAHCLREKHPASGLVELSAERAKNVVRILDKFQKLWTDDPSPSLAIPTPQSPALAGEESGRSERMVRVTCAKCGRALSSNKHQALRTFSYHILSKAHGWLPEPQVKCNLCPSLFRSHSNAGFHSVNVHAAKNAFHFTGNREAVWEELLTSFPDVITGLPNARSPDSLTFLRPPPSLHGDGLDTSSQSQDRESPVAAEEDLVWYRKGKCEICGSGLRSVSASGFTRDAIRHVLSRAHGWAKEPHFACAHCQNRFFSLQAAHNHILNLHPDATTNRHPHFVGDEQGVWEEAMAAFPRLGAEGSGTAKHPVLWLQEMKLPSPAPLPHLHFHPTQSPQLSLHQLLSNITSQENPLEST